MICGKRWAVCSSLLFCQNRQTESVARIYFTNLNLGGVLLKAQEIMLTCHYTEEEISAAQIIQDSFEIFLKKELQHVEKYLCATV